MLRSLSLRWKILLALLSLSLASLVIIVALFTGMSDHQQLEQKRHLATLNGKLVVQSLSEVEYVLRTQLQPLDNDPNLITAINQIQFQEDHSSLQLLLQQILDRYDLDRLELLLPNSRLYRLEAGAEKQDLQKLQLSKDQAEGITLSAPATSDLLLSSKSPGIEISLPLTQQGIAVARLTAIRNIDDRLTVQLQERVDTELIFHNGQTIVGSSSPDLKQISLTAALQGGHTTVLNDVSYAIHPLSFDTGGESGLLLATDETRNMELAATFRKNLIFAALAVLLLATVAALVLSRKISKPLQQVVDSLQEITDGGGDLTQALSASSENELGVLSSSLNRLMSRLHEVVFRTRTTSLSLTQSIEKMSSHATMVNSSALEQASSTENAHRAISEIGKAAEMIAENVSHLVASVQESAAATHQFGSTTLSISHQMENLFGAVNDISASIQQLSGSNEQIDTNINELYSGAQNTVHAIEQLEQATGAIEEGAQQTSQRALEAAAQALDGKAAVQDTIRGISGLQQLIEQAYKAILELGSRSDAIGSIVNVIADVADQTNLLALNAAIIAAQAGDHGQGFAVVAEEIRSLAERTTTSADEITEIINNLQSGTRTAVQAIEAGSDRAKQEVAHSHAAGKVLEKLHDGAIASTEQVQSIVDQTQKQSEESRKITQAATGITSMLEQIAGSMCQQTESTKQMANAAKSMTTIAAKVKSSTDEQNRGGQQLAQSIEHIQQMIEQIDAATQDQNLRSKQVIEAVSSVRKIAEENSSRAGEMSKVVESLAGQAKSLHQDTLLQGEE